jgi:hypothetical protein
MAFHFVHVILNSIDVLGVSSTVVSKCLVDSILARFNYIFK